jgi:hypothetical protein
VNKRYKIEDNKDSTKKATMENFRRLLISRFLFKLEKYMTVDVICQAMFNNTCVNCGDVKEDNVCETCGLDENIHVEKVESPNTEHRYSDRDNFIRCLNRHSGKEELPSETMTDIKTKLLNYFEANEIDITTVDREGLRQALKVTNVKQYENVNSIGYNVLGWDLPDLLHLEEGIMRVYDTTQRAYQRIRKSGTSNLSVAFRLFAILRYLGAVAERDDFNLPKLDATYKANIKLWTEMLEQANLSTESVKGLKV